MKTSNIFVSILAVFVTLNSKAESALDVYLSYLQNPRLLENADDPRATEVQTMIRALAPEINFHPEERFPPMDPLEFISRSSLRRGNFRNSDKISGVGEFTPQSLSTLDKSYFLRLEDSRRAPLERPAPLIWELSPTPLLSRLPSRAGARWIMIDYWFTTAYNEALFLFKLGNHQSEWEGQGFLVEISTDSEGKLQHRLGGAYYAHHMTGTWYCPSELEWTEGSAGGGHPRAYSAHGSHASYSKAGKFPRRGGIFGHDHTKSGGLVFEGWENLRPLLLEPYYGFKGGWGSRGFISAMSGPQAPGSEKFYPRETDERSLTRMRELLENRCGIKTSTPLETELN